jgi:hypothetical protein
MARCGPSRAMWAFVRCTDRLKSSADLGDAAGQHVHRPPSGWATAARPASCWSGWWTASCCGPPGRCPTRSGRRRTPNPRPSSARRPAAGDAVDAGRAVLGRRRPRGRGRDLRRHGRSAGGGRGPPGSAAPSRCAICTPRAPRQAPPATWQPPPKPVSFSAASGTSRGLPPCAVLPVSWRRATTSMSPAG